MAQLRFRTPANWSWEKALPIGSGKLGAMIYGEASMEHYQLNEDSVWYGGALNRVNPDAKKYLPKVRNLIFDGKIHDAERLMKFAFTAVPQSERSYQTLGNVFMDFFDSIGETESFERSLDLETAIHTVIVKDKKSGITYTRETFASAEKNCIITRFTADREKSISIGAVASREGFCDASEREGDMTFFSGTLGTEESSFVSGMKLCAKGAEVKTIGEHLVTEHADEAVLYLSAGTTFRYENPKQEVIHFLQNASETDYEKLKEEHIKEYRSYFSKTTLQLSKDETEVKTSFLEDSFAKAKEGKSDNELIKLYFDFGRYLLISASRPGSLPANLQGIWNRDMTPAWGSKYTININTEMNYWPAEMYGLSDCHLPLFDLLLRLSVNGEKVAKEMYGCRGFVVHHNTDITADCAPQDMYTPATIWPMGGAWLCTHVWSHYSYTKDMDFLNKMYPVVKKCVLFYFDYLVEKEGKLVTCPSVSPENTYILESGERGCVCYGATMDSQILRDLFSQFLKEAEIVGETDKEFLSNANRILSLLPKTEIGSKGQILEWCHEYGEAEPGHRHISHLYALHPSHQIQMERTPSLAKAARTTLSLRLSSGGGHTGWSRAWIMNMYARLWDGEESYQNLLKLLQNSTLPNLFDNHPPFQIDGNFGATAAIGEMLFQSEEGEAYLLPAKPNAFTDGKLTGIYAEGGAVYSITFRNGELTACTIKALAPYKAAVHYQGKTVFVALKTGEEKQLLFSSFT